MIKKIQCEHNPARSGKKGKQVNSGLDQAIETSVKAALTTLVRRVLDMCNEI